MTEELPEGVTYNDKSNKEFDFERTIQQNSIWKCVNCELSFETVILGDNGRYEGFIINPISKNVLWKGVLPKNEDKAANYLKSQLEQKIERHKGSH